jgi:hypothetical protein
VAAIATLRLIVLFFNLMMQESRETEALPQLGIFLFSLLQQRTSRQEAFRNLEQHEENS